VCFNPGFVVVVHSSFFFTQLLEVLLEIQQLVLEGLVVVFLLAQLSRLLLEVGDDAVFVVSHPLEIKNKI